MGKIFGGGGGDSRPAPVQQPPDPPPAPPPVPKKEDIAPDTKAGEKAMTEVKKIRKSGRGSTILTGGQGLTDAATTGQKKLLGQ